ncbi:MAG: hypothetical protein ACRCXH_14305 [Shewanella sp.]
MANNSRIRRQIADLHAAYDKVSTGAGVNALLSLVLGAVTAIVAVKHQHVTLGIVGALQTVFAFLLLGYIDRSSRAIKILANRSKDLL